ncbi:MAG: hypothetical protein HYV93_22510 [Candidatus Rokubacteria bacterium]|nr:hypothetical protein [Candidatus Rokubacteria bacterium]
MAVAVALMGAALGPVDIARAQVQVRLSGRIETTGGLDRLRTGDSTAQTLSWGSLYSPTLDGFVWSPRFLVFSAAGTYADQSTEGSGASSESVLLDPYQIRLNFFPQSPHSFDIEASRSVAESTFSQSGISLFTTVTTERQGVGWNYRGSALLPESSVAFRRETVETIGPGLVLDETRMSASLDLRKSFERATPTVSYRLESVERNRQGTGAEGLPEQDLTHSLQYQDRVRIGAQGFLTPSLTYRRSELEQQASGALGLAGPLSPTLDGGATMRYTVDERAGSTTQSVAADGTLTKRITPNLTVTGGANGGLVGTEGIDWFGGLFSGVSATPLPHLRTAADYGTQITGGEQAATISHRGHLGAGSTFFPRHTLTADYYVNLFERGGSAEPFVSQSGSLGVTSLVIPRTTLEGTVGLDRQEGDGTQDGQRARLEAVVTVAPPLTLRAASEYTHRATSGGGRVPTEETSYAGEGGIDAAPLYWLTLSLSGRRGVRQVQLEDKSGDFDSDAIRGQATVRLGTLQGQVEGFLEREPVVDEVRHGVRGSVSYRFRIWSITLDFEQSVLTRPDTDTERSRVFLRITRPLSYSFAWP